MKKTFKLFKGFRLLGVFNSIEEAKKQAPNEDGVYNLIGENYRSSWQIISGKLYIYE